MVELIKWWNNSKVRLILRYEPRTFKGRVISSKNYERIIAKNGLTTLFLNDLSLKLRIY